MSRLLRAWGAMSSERRLAAVAAVSLLVTMFLPWYGLQNLDRRTGAIYSHNIDAFGDVSFVEAAIFLVAAGVIAMLLARAERRDFTLPGGDGMIVTIAGCWATLLIFYRVFDRPAGHGYPVGIQWGFFLAFVASCSLAYAGWRIRHGERPEPPLVRRRPTPSDRRAAERSPHEAPEPGTVRAERLPATEPGRRRREETGETALLPVGADRRARPAPARPAPPERRRPRFPPAPGEPEQLSFEDPPEAR